MLDAHGGIVTLAEHRVAVSLFDCGVVRTVDTSTANARGASDEDGGARFDAGGALPSSSGAWNHHVAGWRGQAGEGGASGARVDKKKTR